MKKRSRIICLVLALMLLIGILSACSPSANNNPPASGSPGTSQPSSSPAAPAGRTNINLSVNSVEGTTDYMLLNNLVGRLMVYNVYDALYHVDDFGGLHPRIAKSYTIGDDDRTYTFNLRDDVYFHNDEKLKASDVIFTIDRLYSMPYFDMHTAHIDSYKAIDDYTVEIVSKTPLAMFMYSISLFKIMSEKAVREGGDDLFLTAETSRAGCGPYYYTEFNPDSVIKLEAFPKYYRGEASIKSITYKYIPDPTTALVAFEAGEIDFVSLPVANVAEMQQTGKYNVILNPSSHISYIAFNINKEPFNNKLVRQALGYAINKEEILLGAYNNYGDIAVGSLAREGFMFGGINEGIPTYTYDPVKAKELLTQAGYPDGFDAGTIIALGNMYFKRGAEIIQQSFADVGVTVRVEGLESSALSEQLFINQTFDVAYHGDPATIDSDNVYNQFYSPDNAMTMKGFNPRIIELCNLGKVTVDPEQRKEIYKEFWAIAMEEANFIPTFHRANPYIANNDLNVEMGTTFFFIYDFSWK